ncbi:MAG: serine/threonine protein kinase, partial [Massilia sp.]
MTRHLHESANAVLYRALDLPAGDRQQFIAQATAGDLNLFEDVRTMLSRIEQLDQFLEDPLELPAEVKPAPPVLPRHGELIGRWRVEYELGRNGADLILLVRDEQGAGPAATMRLAEAASRSGQTGARFDRLRARLATLEHPAIPVPIDAGSTPDGRPYFVVGRGAGTPIDQYCAAQQLDLAQRALLFAQVCRAVHYMHQHLIVHRDLKPADMLVLGDASLTLLDVGMIGDGWPLDPAYASPDQVAGRPLSAGSDIYSLGAVLYGLVSGRRAHGGGDAASVISAAASSSVKAPSLAVRDAIAHGAAPQDDPVLEPGEALADQLQKHFDGIVMQALALDPAVRFASAHALALDLEAVAQRIEAAALSAVAAAAPVQTDTLASAPEVDAAPATVAPTPMSAPQWPAPRRSPILLAIAMLATGLVAGALAAPWLQQARWLPLPTGVSPPAPAPATLRAGPPASKRNATAAAVPASAPGNNPISAERAIALGEQGRTDEALAALRQALSLQQAHAAMDDARDKQQATRAAADIHRAIAEVLAGTGDPAGAEA